MKSLIKSEHYIKVLRDSNKKFRQLMLKNATPEQRKVLLEMLVNTVHGNVPLNKNQRQGLQKHKSKLRKICASCYKKNKIINNRNVKIEQIGGVLPFLIPPILALIGKAAATGAIGATAGYATKKIINAATGEK